MKKTKLLFLLLFLLAGSSIYAQTDKIPGMWYTIDEDGNKKSLVKIYRAQNGTFEGVIEKLLTGDPARKCVNCTGADKGKPIAGMIFIKNLRPGGGKLSGGTILDPANGKIYNCTITLDKGGSKLKVRGSLDKSGLIGRNQTWEKVPSVD